MKTKRKENQSFEESKRKKIDFYRSPVQINIIADVIFFLRQHSGTRRFSTE
jgi:hypothetical protein